jgi:hypothetical protein
MGGHHAGLKDLEKNAREVAPLLDRARAAATPEQLREAMSAVAAHPTYSVLVPVLARWRRDTTVSASSTTHLRVRWSR